MVAPAVSSRPQNVKRQHLFSIYIVIFSEYKYPNTNCTFHQCYLSQQLLFQDTYTCRMRHAAAAVEYQLLQMGLNRRQCTLQVSAGSSGTTSWRR